MEIQSLQHILVKSLLLPIWSLRKGRPVGVDRSDTSASMPALVAARCPGGWRFLGSPSKLLWINPGPVLLHGILESVSQFPHAFLQDYTSWHFHAFFFFQIISKGDEHILSRQGMEAFPAPLHPPRSISLHPLPQLV